MRTDPRMPPLDQVVLRDVLEKHAKEHPDKVFAVFDDGTTWLYREALEHALRAAAGLRKLGVAQGDHVVSWLPNGADALRVWFGLNCLGAVVVPINLSYRGRLLEHVIRNSDAKLIVMHSELVDRLDEVDLAGLTQAVVLDGSALPKRLRVHDGEALETEGAADVPLERPIAPWDTQSIIYTSGTTGPSKGVLSSYYHMRMAGMSMQDLNENDRFFVNLPLFHVGGTFPVIGMLVRGGSIFVTTGFNTSTFWALVREHRITASIVLGAMAGFLLKQPESPDDRNHSLRWATLVPYNETAMQFGRRFGCDGYTHFNMTELSMPIVSEANPPKPGCAGRPRAGVELRIVDDNDCEVPNGTIGELVVRTDCPWALNHGYNGDPEATARAMRNGWFHTGDAFRKDADGVYFFVDRLKDAIRRRGENISSAEVESELLMHPDLLEAAAVAVPSELGEDDVMAVVVRRPGSTLEAEELVKFLIPRMPHYMVPRYVRFVPELPRTPTHKIQKTLLRDHPLQGDDVWDRETAGLVVKGTRIGRRTDPSQCESTSKALKPEPPSSGTTQGDTSL